VEFRQTIMHKNFLGIRRQIAGGLKSPRRRKIAAVVFLTMMVLAGMACAADSTKLPSSKASVVLPLLKKLSATAHPTLDEVGKILGPPGVEISNAGGLQIHYTLDDKTDVGVEVYDRPGHEMISIWVEEPGGKIQNLYVRPPGH
jgi:hypothetical protein